MKRIVAVALIAIVCVSATVATAALIFPLLRIVSLGSNSVLRVLAREAIKSIGRELYDSPNSIIVSVPTGVSVPTSRSIPTSTSIPTSVSVPTSTSVPTGVSVPTSTSVPTGVSVPTGFSIPVGVSVPSGLSVPSQPASPEELVWAFSNHHSNVVGIQLYRMHGAERGIEPGPDQAYELRSGESGVIRIRCRSHQNVCFGAWSNGKYWGVGFNGASTCSRCCRPCGTRLATITLH